MIINLDIDGVLSDFTGAWVRTYNEWFNARVDVEDAVEWMSCVELTHFSSEGDFFAWLDRVPGFWASHDPIPGAFGGVLELLELGHQLQLVTNRSENRRIDTRAWVSSHWPVGFDLPPIHYAQDKSVVPAQLWVDDSPHVVATLTKKRLPVLKFEQPWNKGVKAHLGSVPDWDALVKRIAGFHSQGAVA